MIEYSARTYGTGDAIISAITHDGETEIGVSITVSKQNVALLTPKLLVTFCDRMAFSIKRRLEARHRQRFNDVFPPTYAEDDDVAV